MTVPGGYVAGDVLTAANMNLLPGGIKGLASGTATTWTNATTTPSDITASAGTSPTLTLTLSTSRQYRMNFMCQFAHSSGTVHCTVRFIEGGTNRGGYIFLPAVTGASTTVLHQYVFTPASGSSVVYKVQGALFSASGTVSAVVSATDPMRFWIEDLGV